MVARILLYVLGSAWAIMPIAAQAEELTEELIHGYEYENVVVGRATELKGKGYVPVRLELPPGVEGYMGTPHLKDCEVRGYPPAVLDEDVTFKVWKRHPDRGHVVVIIGDLHPGRTQFYCPRLPYVPRVTEPEAHIRLLYPPPLEEESE